MLSLNLKGKRALIAGVADDGGFGFAIAKTLAEAGATVCVGTWPPAYGIFTKLLERGKLDKSRVMEDGSMLEFEAIYALDADYDTLEDIPEEVAQSRRYRDHGDCSIAGVAGKMQNDFGDSPVDIVVHSLANGPEVKNELLKTSRSGYLAALGVSSYSFTSMVAKFSPIMREGGAFAALTYMASERVIPGYGGGMSSAKAALESDTRVLAYEAGRAHGHRVNVVSAGPYASRAASAIGIIGDMVDYAQKNAPIQQALEASEVAQAMTFLVSPMASGITGTTLYVDKGFHTMGMATDLQGAQ